MTQHFEYSESPCEAGSILPSQFFDGRKKKEAVEPLKRLMLAVLADAVHCNQTGFDTRQPPAGVHFSKPSGGCLTPEWMAHFLSKTCVASSILLPIIFARCCATGGPEAWRHFCPPRPSLSSDLSEAGDTVQMRHEITKNN